MHEPGESSRSQARGGAHRLDPTGAETGTAGGTGAAPAASGGTSFSDRLAFLRGFIRDPAGVGSVAPSSHRLEQRLVRRARIAEARTVVELGPGTGGTTRAFLRAMGPQARLLAIELDPVFHARLAASIRDPRLFVECASAERIGELLAARRLPAPEAIVSGIPFSTMPPEVCERIAAAASAVLAPGGRFVAYQVRPQVAGYLTPHLGEPRREWEPWNIPPMRVFSWVKPG